MTNQHFGPPPTPGSHNAPDGSAASTTAAGATAIGATLKPGNKQPHAVTGPFTVRDLVVFGGAVVLFIGSLLPITRSFAYTNFWTGSGLFFLILGLLLPLAVGVLFLVRRLSPTTRLRIGSLSVDQFASVVAAYAAGFFFWGLVAATTAGYVVGFIGALALLLATTFAPLLPFFSADFAGRVPAPAHVVALDAVPAVVTPKAPRPAKPSAGNTPVGTGATQMVKTSAAETPQSKTFVATTPETTTHATAAPGTAPLGTTTPATATAGTATPAAATPDLPQTGSATATPAASATDEAAHELVGQENPVAEPATQHLTAARPESIGATKNPQESTHPAAQPEYEAFWFAVDRRKPVVDERSGAFLYDLEPGNWVLALADRGSDFLVQNVDGRVGVLRDLTNIERAPEGD